MVTKYFVRIPLQIGKHSPNLILTYLESEKKLKLISYNPFREETPLTKVNKNFCMIFGNESSPKLFPNNLKTLCIFADNLPSSVKEQ